MNRLLHPSRLGIQLLQILLLVIVFLLILFVRQHLNVILLFPFVLLLSFYFWVKKAHLFQAQLSIFVICMGSDILTYLFCAALLFYFLLQGTIRDKIFFERNGISYVVLIFFGIGLLSYSLSQFFELNLLSFPLHFVTFWILFAPLFYFSKNSLSKYEWQIFFRFIFLVLIAQSIVTLIDLGGLSGLLSVLSGNRTPDDVKGTTGSAHSLGIFFLMSIAVLNKNLFKGQFLRLFAVILIFLILIAAGAKLHTAVMIASTLTLLLFLSFLIKGKLKYYAVPVFVVMLLVSYSLILKLSKYSDYFKPYLAGNVSHKVEYYKRAFDPSERNIIQYLIGTGPGTCGSRAANARATDILYKRDDAVKIPSFIPEFTSVYAYNVLGGLYSKKYAEEVTWHSGALAIPFNSFVALFVELGVAGVALMMTIFALVIYYSVKLLNSRRIEGADRRFLYGMVVITIYLFITSLFEQMFEKGVAMFLYWFFVARLISILKAQQQIRHLSVV